MELYRINAIKNGVEFEQLNLSNAFKCNYEKSV